METAPRQQLFHLQSYNLSRTVYHAYKNVPMYRKRMDEAGVKPEDILSVNDLKKLPFTYKQDLRDNYPYACLLYRRPSSSAYTRLPAPPESRRSSGTRIMT